MFNHAENFSIHGGSFINNNNPQDILIKLNPVKNASFKSDRHSSCLEGTRTEILDMLMDWAKDSHSKPIFWLSGIAGTGKSTIAQSFCERLHDNELLGASFFCSRESENLRQVGRILPTLAYFLAKKHKEYHDQIASALEADSTLPFQGVKRQLESLFTHPFKSSIMSKSSWHFILVLDALDECEDMDATQNILSILGNMAEYYIQKELERNININLFKLNDIKSEIVQKDIQLYLKSALDDISESDIACLAEQADRLFIYAFTQVQYLKRAPGEVTMHSRLNELLRNKGIAKSIDSLYNALLQRLGEGMEVQEKENARYFINIVVSLSDPLSQHALSELWKPCDVGPFRSLLNIPDSEDAPIHIFHASFSDYILDKGRCLTEFYSCSEEVHQIMTLACIRSMHMNLKYNICSMETDDHFASFHKDHISPALQYSCKHWIFHLTRCGTCLTPSLRDEILIAIEKFARECLFYWIETMGILHSIENTIPGLQFVLIWLKGYRNQGTEFLESVIYEGRRFLQLIVNLIKDYPLQLYYSGIAWLPRLSVLHNIQGIPQNVPKVLHGMQSTWDMCEVIIRCSSPIQCVGFSPDGTQVVCGSYDQTVCIWNVATGKEIQKFEGHSGAVRSVAFSPKGKQVVSGSDDEIVCVWNIATGKQVQRFEGHSGGVNSVAFSPNGKQVVSGSTDNTACIWNVATGKQIQELEGHNDWVRSVAFSPDGKQVVSGSDDKVAHIWNVATGEQIQKLEGHFNLVRSVAFSPDGKHVVSGSDDKTVRIWNTTTGKHILILEGHSGGVNSVAFSPDGKKVVSGSDDKTVCIWNVASGKQAQRLEGHSDFVNSVAFCPDSKQVVSGADDKTVCIWNVATWKQFQKLESHHDWVRSVAFSPDGKQVVSGSDDQTVCVWDIATGKQVLCLEGHSGGVNSVAFSPDGKQVVSGSRTFSVWNLATGKRVQKFKCHLTSWMSVAISSDSKQVVSRSLDNTVYVWNIVTGKLISTTCHSSSHSLSFIPVSPFFQGGFICFPKPPKFWLLPKYQDLQVIDQYKSTVCFGCVSGAIVVIQMDAQSQPQLESTMVVRGPPKNSRLTQLRLLGASQDYLTG